MTSRLPTHRPLVCFITDRRRWAADASREPSVEEVVSRVGAAAEAGIELVQVREPDLEARALCDLVTRSIAAVRGTRTKVIVNERVDVALATGADGVHLRASSIAPAEARRIVLPECLVGRSVHAVGDVSKAAVAGADYVIAGTVFPSRSKPVTHRLLGIDGLRAVVEASPVPVLGIGGVSLASLAALARVGAVGVAAIDLFAEAGESAAAWRALLLRIRESFE